jgi:hypothetical protein
MMERRERREKRRDRRREEEEGRWERKEKDGSILERW